MGTEQIRQGHHDDSHTASNMYTSLLTDHRLGNFDFSYHGLSLAAIEPQHFEVEILCLRGWKWGMFPGVRGLGGDDGDGGGGCSDGI